MDFALTEQQREIQTAVRRFIERECPREELRRLDLEAEFPRAIWKKLADAGWLGIAIAEEYGGGGGSLLDNVIFTEELGRGSAALAYTYVTCASFGAKTVGTYGNDAQRAEFLPGLLNGDSIFALGFTEPSGGSDALSLRTRADRDGDDFVLNGQKVFTSLAHEADNIVVVARVGDRQEKKTAGITIFLVDSTSPGLEIRPLKTLGYRSTETNEVFFDNVRVPASRVLGEVGTGWGAFVSTLNAERTLAASLALGIAQAAYDDARKYALEREAFGRPIAGFQAIQHYLVEMANLIEAAQLITYKSAWRVDNGLDAGLTSTRAKVMASEAAVRCAQLGMRTLAGWGYTMEFDMQRYFRDAQLLVSGVITNEMATNFMAEQLGLPRSY